MAVDDRQRGRITRALLVAAGGGLFVLSLVYNEFALGAMLGSLSDRAVGRIRTAQLAMLVPGASMLACAFALARWPAAERIAGSPRLPMILLVSLSLVLPLWLLEWGLRPFSPVPVPVTGAYLRDDDLGWRLRPGYRGPDLGGGPDFRVNRKGLRGPEVEYEKPAGVKRILYLGDSVAFGWKLPHRDTFPARAEPHIARLARVEVETINSGVGGYSPWQELVYLREEGLRYDPDLVLVSFVLNDVTEKFSLERFGGRWEGTQLAMTADNLTDWLTARSALANQVQRELSWAHGSDDPQAAARRAEELRVEHLVNVPSDPRVLEAWEVTLENLGRIFDLCREREIPVALVIFPYAFQFENLVGYSGPQLRLLEFARERDVPALDLLPALARRLELTGSSAERYFFDANHLTPAGSEAVARVLIAFLRDGGLL